MFLFSKVWISSAECDSVQQSATQFTRVCLVECDSAQYSVIPLSGVQFSPAECDSFTVWFIYSECESVHQSVIQLSRACFSWTGFKCDSVQQCLIQFSRMWVWLGSADSASVQCRRLTLSFCPCSLHSFLYAISQLIETLLFCSPYTVQGAGYWGQNSQANYWNYKVNGIKFS